MDITKSKLNNYNQLANLLLGVFMHISLVKIKNFRNLKNIEVKLDAGVNVILGENNVGKTNLLDAIRVALGSQSSTSGDLVRLGKEDLTRNENGDIENFQIRIDLEFSSLDKNERAEFIDILNYNPTNPDQSTASIHFEWSWNDSTQRWHQRRWGANSDSGDRSTPDEVLQAIPHTTLTALRDALRELAPGKNSKLGKLMSNIANDGQKDAIKTIFNKANEDLEKDVLVKNVEQKIDGALKATAGAIFSQSPKIRTSDSSFDKIVNALRLSIAISPNSFMELDENGLGYNNLIFISTVMAELSSSKTATLPILLVEEPEAHLHPQLQVLLARCLSNVLKVEGSNAVQTIITSHSPHIAIETSLETLCVLHFNSKKDRVCVRLVAKDISDKEKRKLARMLDVSKASFLFSRGVILVEGITEALLLPILSKRIGIDLAENGISVVPICGVDFKTLTRLFGKDGLQIPVAVITDADPKVIKNGDWATATPKTDPITNAIIKSDRLLDLENEYVNNDFIKLFSSSVTLEYDLAIAGNSNSETMCEAWLGCYSQPSRSLLKKQDLQGKTLQEKTNLVWQKVCHSESSISKGDFASSLMHILQEKNEGTETFKYEFEVPDYIKNAVKYVMSNANAE